MADQNGMHRAPAVPDARVPGTARTAGRPHGKARPAPLFSSRNMLPARPVRGRPWNSRRCAPTVRTARTPSAMTGRL